MRIGRTAGRFESGQSLVEIALMLPILLILVLNAINNRHI
jgi:hypothetical protein